MKKLLVVAIMAVVLVSGCGGRNAPPQVIDETAEVPSEFADLYSELDSYIGRFEAPPSSSNIK